MISERRIPNHVAIIMDGNGRWAQKRGKMRAIGHRAGLKAVRKIVRYVKAIGINALTLYAFSSENWRRPENEVSALMSLFIYALNREAKILHKNDIRLNIIGDISRFSSQLQDMITNVHQLTANNNGLILNIAANYGGRWDIVQSTKKIAHKVEKGEILVDNIDEELINCHMSLSDLPDIDLVIRTGGEYRISNFLLWQVAYSELYFTEVLWPDFNQSFFEEAIAAFNERTRKFGRVVDSNVI